MPKVSQRKLIIKYLESELLDSIVFDDTSEEEMNYLLLAYALEQRYLAPRTFVPKMNTTLKTNLLMDLDNNKLQQEIRMSLNSFNLLYNMISTHSAYKGSDNRKSTDIKIQMIVALERFDRGCNGASVEGSVANFTNRFMLTVIDTLEHYIAWPSSEKRVQIKEEIEETYGFPSCIGFVDEALFPLAFTPPRSVRSFYRHKELYVASCLIACDNKKRITMAFPNSGDISPLEIDPESHFADEEYLLAGSSHTTPLNMISKIEECKSSQLSKEDKSFNNLHKTARVQVDHCIGILKENNEEIDKNWKTSVKDNDESSSDSPVSVDFQSTVKSGIVADESLPLRDARNGFEKRVILKRVLRESSWI